jgi:outer membrane protein insertion porin family
MSTGNSTSRYLFLLVWLFPLFACLASTDLKIAKINFTGNHFTSAKKLKGLIKSKEKKPFDARLTKLDQVLLTNFYLRNGFLKVFVSGDFKRKADKIYLDYSISEGRRYFLKSLSFDGNTIVSNAQLRRKIPHKLHRPYSSTVVSDGIARIENYYMNNGKPYVEVEEITEVVDDSLIDLTVRIHENQTVTITQVEINGLKAVRRYVAAREIEMKRGQKYSRDKIERSQRNLYSTGLFTLVNFRLEHLDSLKTTAKLIVTVSEKKSRWVGVRFGVAYEQEIIYGGTFDFGVEAGHRNLFGTGRTASANIIPSLSYDFQTHEIINPKNQYSFNYVEPWVGYTRTRGIAKIAYFQVRPSRTANYNLLLTSFKITHDFPNLWSIESELAFQRIETDSLQLLSDTQGQDRIYSISFDFIRDKRDNYLNTKKGYLMEFRNKFEYSNSFDLANNASEINRFIKVTALWNRYQPFPLVNNWTLASRVRGGTIIGINYLTRIPPTERFYLGGASSVRGYREQLVGPLVYDAQGNAAALGGRYMILGNMELRIPLFWLFYGVVFTDGGNVWSGFDKITASLKTSSGAGLALMTPLGAIRFDYGLKWFPKANESKREFHIGISFAF